MSTSFIDLNTDGSIQVTEDVLRVIGEKRLLDWASYSVRKDSDAFVSFVRVNYLTTQRLNVVTGRTRDHIGTWTKQRKNGKRVHIQTIRPGKGIQGVQNYLEKWAGTEHEFMLPAFRDFALEQRMSRDIRENIVMMGNKTLDELTKERP